MQQPNPPFPDSVRERARAALAVLVAVGLVGFAAAPPALAASGKAAVEINAGTTDEVAFAGQDVMITGVVSAVDPELGRPTGSVRVISHEPGHPVSEATIPDDPFLLEYFSAWVYPTEPGTRSFTVEYSGDAYFAATSQVIRYAVNTGPLTKTTLSVSPQGPVRVGGRITLTANATDDAGRALDAIGANGYVTFFENGKPLGEPIEVTRGTKPGKTLYATLTTSFSRAGTRTITALFEPLFYYYYVESTSPRVSVTVTGAPTPTSTPTVTPTPTGTPTPTATPRPPTAPAAVGGSFTVRPRSGVKAGSAVRAVAEIHDRASGRAVAGSVQFYDGNRKVGKPVALVRGHASMSYSRLAAGEHVLKAKYLGTKAHAAAFTRNVTVTVRK
ncbi:Ig-like domain-containing protein [Cryobacterium sp. 1639]|uniref:Ig-like domain-containing protein n=1 Tax=Cryobacterium inferilacus TaxID=2866629 RepID=UPI001C736439|nr:Ig-like domain-containing protein [Cryobacterium sp. 1639]MBX0301922.1 Ig-like domain-containing protein [Cryobacterium sp. 1639]